MEENAQQHLSALRELITSAKSMPMSSSCVVNRGEALDLVAKLEAAMPAELDQARGVIGDADEHVRRAEARAAEIIADAERRAAELADAEHVAVLARERAEQTRTDADADAEGLRTETDAFIDARMASFESVLHKTLSQVTLARERLSERSDLDADQVDEQPLSGPDDDVQH
ncbi:hypothetical protein ACQCX2_02860 [Propionibacteriaceae bacterium Y1700]|uniref:hypothetical protein n=1 Tax=Microlunatus sp. Y1700 TaxID=3418487 RepID=UPI003DA6EA3A